MDAQIVTLNQIQLIETGEDPSPQDEDGSKTTYESCSSQSDKSDNEDHYRTVIRENKQDGDQEKSTQIQKQDNDQQLQDSTNERTSDVPKLQLIENNSQQELPPQFKTLRLSNLKEAKLIQFEEYEPQNNSNRNDQLLTGGRLTSCASNSNKFSLSKTFNFHMAYLNQQDEQSQESQQNSNRNDIQTEQEMMHNDLTQRVDEKIRMIAEEYQLLAQTQKLQDFQKSQSFHQDIQMDSLNSERNQPTQVKQGQKRNQSHESTQQPFVRYTITGNNFISDQENSDNNAALNYKRSSLVQRQRLQDRMSSTLNRGFNNTNQVKELTFSKSNFGSFIQGSQNTVVRNMQSNDITSDKHVEMNQPEGQYSESSSNKNKNSTYPFNGLGSQGFNRTVAFGQGSLNLNSKKLEDQVAELKYMLENVQCEAKNLKLLLNLKDDQIQMYESKNQDLINENEDYQYKCEEQKQRLDVIEEENLYLKAIINSHNIPMNKLSKQNIGINTEEVEMISQQCQATFPQLKISQITQNSIALSPIKNADIDIKNEQQKYEELLLKYDEQGKENINLTNIIKEQDEKIKLLECETSMFQNQYKQQVKENQEIKKQIQHENKSLYWQIENTKQQIIEREQKMVEVMQILEDTKLNGKKKSGKIKSLKKERDQLRIEILKLKQIYSDKCDSYKDSKLKLQKKLKKRDDLIQKLQEQIISLDSYCRNMNQYTNRNQNIQNMRVDQNQKHAVHGKMGNDLNQSGVQLFRSSISSKSLENTRNLNSTTKGMLRGLNQMAQKNDPSKEQSQNMKDLLLGANNPHNTSLSNPPKSKNLTPGSLPSGSGAVHGIHQYNQIDDFQREKIMQKLKNQYKKLDLEEEKLQMIQAQRHNYQGNILPSGAIYNKNINHFISNDKSKSFYSSDIENNTLFDQHHIALEDQSNSSNFFSNINNSNSHLFLDDSTTIVNRTTNDYNSHQMQKQFDFERQRQFAKNEPHQQQIAFAEQQFNHNFPKVTQQAQLMAQNQPKVKGSFVKHQQLNPQFISQLQSLPHDDYAAYLYQQNRNSQQQSKPSRGNNPPSASQSKSPISKPKDVNKMDQQNLNVIQRNTSSHNLSQGELHNNTQNSIRQIRNDSTTSSNRNLHQLKEAVRPPSSSSTNNTSAFYHNQVAMISYQSSSSGGSKQYQSKLSKLAKQYHQQNPPPISSYIPYYNTNSNLPQQHPYPQYSSSQVPPNNYATYKQQQKYYQAGQNQGMTHSYKMNSIAPMNEEKGHRRERSKQMDLDIANNTGIVNEDKGNEIAQGRSYYKQHSFNQ